MGFIEIYCSDCSQFYCLTFAKYFLMEFESFKGRLFSVNCDLQCEEGICDAIGVFESVLMSLCDSVNCDAIDSEMLE